MAENFEQTLAHVNTYSKPTELRITDMRFVDIVGAPMHCTLLRIETNQGITGYGEVRDGAAKLYAQMLKRFLIGENPCNIDKIFRRIKQYGGQSRQAGGVCGVSWLCGISPVRLTASRFTRCWAASSATRSACTAIPTLTARTPV